MIDLKNAMALALEAPVDGGTAAERAAKEAATIEAVRQDLVRASLLHPDWNGLAELAQHRAMLMTKLAIQCMAICGFGPDQDFKRVDR